MIFKVIRNISLKSPKKAPVLIFDNVGSEILKKYVLSDIDYSILYERLEFFYLSPRILICILKKLFIGKLLGNGFLSKLYIAYVVSCIEYVDPKVVITTIDNNPLFYLISNYFPRVTFYALQNGLRSPQDWRIIQERLSSFGNYYNVILICFGNKEKVSWLNSNIDLKEIIPAGSLKVSVYADIFAKSHIRNESSEICLVSNYGGDILHPEPNVDHMVIQEIFNGMNKLNFFLKILIEDTGYKLCIALRPNIIEDTIKEIDYYKDYFGDSINLIPNCLETFSTYSAMDSSILTITYGSSCGMEAIGLGKKVLYCGQNNLKSDFFGELELPLLFVPNDDYEIFKGKIVDLINMDNDIYLEELQEAKRHLMNNNENFPLYLYLRDSINKAICH